MNKLSMIYLIWGLLNIGLFIFFIGICLKATKLLKENSGIVAAIIFVFGILSFIVNSNNKTSNKESGLSQIPTWHFVSEESVDRNTISYTVVEMEKNWMSKNELGISYGKNGKREEIIPISGNSWTSGFISGTNWSPSIIEVHNKDENASLEYNVTGIIEWKLLGATIYSQLKKYKGTASIK